MRTGQSRRRDTTEAAIVQALRQCGALVMYLSEAGAPDLLVYVPSKMLFLLMECKTAHGRATLAQERRALEGWPSVTCRTVGEALAAIGVQP